MEIQQELTQQKTAVRLKNHYVFFTEQYKELADARKLETLITEIFQIALKADLTDEEYIELDKAMLFVSNLRSSL